MIQMISGVYGLPVFDADGTKRIVGMGPNSGPFSTDAKREAELVELKLAVYVDAVETPSEIEDAEETPLTELSANELRKIAKERGISFKFGIKKEEMIKVLSEEASDNVDEPAKPDEDDVPKNVVDGDAPSFDAAEAVQ